MHIIVNTRLLLKNKLEGIGWYTFETLKRICKAQPQHQFTFLFDRKYDPSFIFSDNIQAKIIGIPARHPFLWYLWFQFSVKKYLSKTKHDLFLSPDGFLPLNIKSKSLAVIHDINFVHFPKHFPFFSRIYYTCFFPKFAKQATRIVSVSNFSRRDISSSLQIDETKIGLSYNGVNTIYKAISEVKKEEVKQNISQGQDYFIFIGAFNPRKNLERLLLAFEMFKNNSSSEMKLVLVGNKMFGTKKMNRIYQSMSHKNDVIFTGSLSPEKLVDLLGAATALCFASLFEGFGIPMLEAFQCDVPVIASNTSSMPEVAGDAALYVSPESVPEICQAMENLAQNKQLREDLIKKGQAQRTKFSWDQTANQLWENIRACL